MKRATPKRSAKSPTKRKKAVAGPAKKGDFLSMGDRCVHCQKRLKAEDSALFVEEEVGRLFCSEPCIAEFFSPEIEALEQEFFKKLGPKDLSGEEREQYAHLRWITLQEPDEVWRRKTKAGDARYTLISEFQPGARKVWCVAICLFLRNEPSFLFLAFCTQSPAMVEFYRKGELLEPPEPRIAKADGAHDASQASGETSAQDGEEEEGSASESTDRLADDWTEEESMRATQVEKRGRHKKDIPQEEFPAYEKHLEDTLDTPDEVWSNTKRSQKYYHFIKCFESKDGGRKKKPQAYWYVVIAKETEESEEIELLDAFPTRDMHLLERYRIGEQEVGTGDPRPSQRFVH